MRIDSESRACVSDASSMLPRRNLIAKILVLESMLVIPLEIPLYFKAYSLWTQIWSSYHPQSGFARITGQSPHFTLCPD